MNRLICIVINLCLGIVWTSFQTRAQEVHHFSKGHIANIESRYGREAIYTDRLAYDLYEGNVMEESAWQPIDTDTLRGFSWRQAGKYIRYTYQSPRDQAALLNVQGASGVFFNGEPHATDPYRSGYLFVPVVLKKGTNVLYVRGMYARASLHFPEKPVFISVADSTVPHIVSGQTADTLYAGVVIMNTSNQPLAQLSLEAELEGKRIITSLPEVPALSMRKVPVAFLSRHISQKGHYSCKLTLRNKDKEIDKKSIGIEALNPGEQYSATFFSNIDGSLQYYAVSPQTAPSENAALFLSVHGAGVEAIGQARAYQPKSWGNLIAATNRRPRGFNWEDWGRLDALEVLAIGKQKFKPDPQKIYLTGHSMGGHGTWFLGATYPDYWAAIAPCAGYPTLKGYGSADGLIPDKAPSSLEQLLLRSSNQSDVIQLARNYKNYGVYIFHGDSDEVVSVDYARQMKKLLAEFHSDMSYYEYPGGSHWFGDISVDWQPLFDFFKWHVRKPDSTMNHIVFTTASPGISANYYWAGIYQQHYPLDYSSYSLHRDLNRSVITGTTKNVRRLKLQLHGFAARSRVQITLDSLSTVTYTTRSNADSIFLVNEAGRWSLSVAPSPKEKGPHRYGTLKDAFNHRMVFVYSTKGTREENQWSEAKARFDAETWYYRGNGAVDVIADKDYVSSKYNDRGVIIYGNAHTNAAWNSLLADCPIQLYRNRVVVGEKTLTGDDLAAYFVWPHPQSDIASVAVIGGTGVKGMKAANGNQYFAGASGFPDFMIFSTEMLRSGTKGVKMAGFYDYKWSIDNKNREVQQ